MIVTVRITIMMMMMIRHRRHSDHLSSIYLSIETLMLWGLSLDDFWGIQGGLSTILALSCTLHKVRPLSCDDDDDDMMMRMFTVRRGLLSVFLL